MKKRYLYERPPGDVRPGDVDAMREFLDLDDGDDEPFRASDEEAIRQRYLAEQPQKPLLERAPWLKPKTQI
jgi:hypothetical protein